MTNLEIAEQLLDDDEALPVDLQAQLIEVDGIDVSSL